ncbi:ion channel TACAN-like [Halichondria panicea]|uniref:ion channel TACAN-like n=1 Tax=Halichondria panicea TaxID=6063 RepID=UPI00312B88E5
MSGLPQEEDSSAQLNQIKKEYNELREKYKDLQDARLKVRKLESSCKGMGSGLQGRLEQLQQHSNNVEVTEEGRQINLGIHEMHCTIPVAPNTLFLRMIIGDIPVILPNREDKVTYKQQYEKFKMVNVVLMLVLGVSGFIFSDFLWPTSLVHILSVWYYFTVTIRELILIHNGSRIKPWWLIHHYCSIAIAALLLMWPPGECYSMFRSQFLLFTCVLAMVMLIQFRYQRAKLYRQVAMGEKHHMTVSNHMKLSDIRFLLGGLVVVYLFQFYNGLFLLKLYTTTDCPHWQVLVLGVLFIVVASLNGSTLSNVIYGKSKKIMKKRLSESFKSF